MKYAIEGVDAGDPDPAVIISDTFYSDALLTPSATSRLARPDSTSARSDPRAATIGRPRRRRLRLRRRLRDADVDCSFDLTWSATY